MHFIRKEIRFILDTSTVDKNKCFKSFKITMKYFYNFTIFMFYDYLLYTVHYIGIQNIQVKNVTNYIKHIIIYLIWCIALLC